LLKWTEPLAMMAALIPDQTQALQIVKLALEVDLMLGARLAGEVKPEFQEQTVGFVEALEAPDWLKVELLGNTRSPNVISELVKALEDRNLDVRLAAVDALGKIANDAAIEGLLKALKNPSSGLIRVIRTLGNVGDQTVVPALIKVLSNPDLDSFIRLESAQALEKLGSKAAIPALLNLVKDSDFFVRLESAKALGKLSSKAAIPVLLDLISQKNFVRPKAIRALIDMGYENSQELLKAFRDDVIERKKNDEASRRSIESEILEALSILEDEEQLDEDLQEAADVLAHLPHKMTTAGLLKLLAEHPHFYTRRLSAEALGNLGDKKAISGLIQALEDSNLELRWIVAEALGNLGSKAAIPELSRMLDERESWLPSMAVGALKEIGGEEVIPDLHKALKYRGESFVRTDAADVLEEIGTPESLAHLWQVQLTDSANNFLSAIAAIQAKYQFYNYALFCSDPVPEDRGHLSDGLSNVYNIGSIKEFTLMSEQAPIFNQQGAAIGVNYAAEGSNPKVIQNVQNAQQASPETALNAVVEIVRALEQKYSSVQDEQEALSIIDVKFKEIKAKQLPQWQDLMNVKRLWNGGKKAVVKVGEHFTDQNPWGKGLVAFLEGVSEDVK